jgi:NADP-dependent 3-hydroxy acid dehydrogenase YdfG
MSLSGLALACEREVSAEGAALTLITALQSRIAALSTSSTDVRTAAEIMTLVEELQAAKKNLAAAVAAAGKS